MNVHYTLTLDNKEPLHHVLLPPELNSRKLVNRLADVCDQKAASTVTPHHLKIFMRRHEVGDRFLDL